MSQAPSSEGDQRLLTFRSGGWVLALAAIPVIAVLLWAGIGIIAQTGGASGGVGQTVESFGFDLSTARIDPAQIMIGAERRDFIEPLHAPSMIDAREVDRINDERRANYLVSDDRLIGVEIDGEARAYPLRMLDWHEVVNDEIAGVPILVSYNGLSDSAAVFDRRIGDGAGGEHTFAASGLVYNSHHLLFDAETERLWLPLATRSVTGEAETLRALPCELVTWADWRGRHPETRVLAPNPDPSRAKYYKRRTYGHYHSSDRLEFPVEPLPPDRDARPLKTPMIAVLLDGAWRSFAIPDLIDRAGDGAVTEETVDGRTLRFHISRQPKTAWVEVVDEAGARPAVMYAFWFAWYAAR